MSGRQPHPGDPDWSLSCARATARAAQEAYALAGELSRRSEILPSVAPKLRVKQAARVVDLLLSDDCVSASRAAMTAGLSDRAARRLFDRLVALRAVRELSGRQIFGCMGCDERDADMQSMKAFRTDVAAPHETRAPSSRRTTRRVAAGDRYEFHKVWPFTC
jgi:hypothetical protein